VSRTLLRLGLVAGVALAVGPAPGDARPAPATPGAGRATAPRTAKPPARSAPDAATFEDLSKKAIEAHAAKKLDEAVEHYEKALKLRPDWSDGRFAQGTVLYDLDRYEEAKAAFRRVTAEQPKSAAAWAFKGLCEFKLKDYENAFNDIQKGRTLGLGENSELQAVASYHAALLMIRSEQYEIAYEVLKDFALRDRDSPGVIEAFGLDVLRMPYLPSEAPPEKREMILMAGRAGFQRAQGPRSPSTRRLFEALVQRYPELPNVRYAWGAYLILDDPQAGLAEFERVLRMDPYSTPAMLQIAFQRIKVGEYTEALPYAEKAAEIAPHNFACRNALGRALLELGETDRAIRELETGARLAPDSPQMFFHLAKAYQRAGRTEDTAKARAMFIQLDKARRAERSQNVGEAHEPGAEPESPAPQE
jgi:tetratricopeptide (TPR) repeat protein